jgi:hypothetical protein
MNNIFQILFNYKVVLKGDEFLLTELLLGERGDIKVLCDLAKFVITSSLV